MHIGMTLSLSTGCSLERECLAAVRPPGAVLTEGAVARLHRRETLEPRHM